MAKYATPTSTSGGILMMITSTMMTNGIQVHYQTSISKKALQRIKKAFNLKAKLKTIYVVEDKMHAIFATETYIKVIHIGVY